MTIAALCDQRDRAIEMVRVELARLYPVGSPVSYWARSNQASPSIGTVLFHGGDGTVGIRPDGWRRRHGMLLEGEPKRVRRVLWRDIII